MKIGVGVRVAVLVGVAVRVGVLVAVALAVLPMVGVPVGGKVGRGSVCGVIAITT